MQLERSEYAVSLDNALSEFVSVRPRLFGIAYRILASRAEAEEIVQDVWLRWQTTDRSVILDAPAFLATMTTRLAINLAQSARSRHATYTGTWLPEPADTSGDPHLGVERGEALELAVLLLLERLSPTERAAYVLREAFDYSHQGIANVLKLTKTNIRQLVSRARKHISDVRRATVDAAEKRHLLVAFIDAAQKGDTAALEELFAADIVSYSDGRGVARTARMLVSGSKRVEKLIALIASHFWISVTFTQIKANELTDRLTSRNVEAVSLVTISASAQGIDQIMWIMRPSKLTAVSHCRYAHWSKRAAPQSPDFPYFSHCSAVSQIGRLSGHSK